MTRLHYMEIIYIFHFVQILYRTLCIIQLRCEYSHILWYPTRFRCCFLFSSVQSLSVFNFRRNSTKTKRNRRYWCVRASILSYETLKCCVNDNKSNLNQAANTNFPNRLQFRLYWHLPNHRAHKVHSLKFYVICITLFTPNSNSIHVWNSFSFCCLFCCCCYSLAKPIRSIRINADLLCGSLSM